jgi:hypothetical protein
MIRRPATTPTDAPVAPSHAVGTGAEHRRAERVRMEGMATILLCRDNGRAGEPRPVRLRDVSLRGVSFVITTPLARGQQFVYHLPPGSNRSTTPVLCTVAYCRPEVDAGYRVGAEFTCVLEQAAPAAQSEPNGAGGDVERIRRSILS